MPVPEFVLALRDKVGHDTLPLVGVTAVVRNDAGEILVGVRADTLDWALPSGIVEPFEEPALALVREVREETGIEVVVEALAACSTTPLVTYPNGDRAAYLDLTFLCRWVSGQARVNDEENLQVGWFATADLPPLRESSAVRLARAMDYDGRTWFAS